MKLERHFVYCICRSCFYEHHNGALLLLYVLGTRSASSPNSPSVRTTRSTFSRYAFTTSRARRTVRVLKVLFGPSCQNPSVLLAIETWTYATRTSSSTSSTRFTTSGCSSLSTSIACFAMDACLADANGTRTVLNDPGHLRTRNNGDGKLSHCMPL